MITREAIQELKDIWAKNYSVELTDDEALNKATALLTLFQSIYKRLPQETGRHEI